MPDTEVVKLFEIITFIFVFLSGSLTINMSVQTLPLINKLISSKGSSAYDTIDNMTENFFCFK